MPLNEFEEIKVMELKDDESIDVVIGMKIISFNFIIFITNIDPYDERTAKLHVRKIQELVSNTHLIPAILGSKSIIILVLFVLIV